MDTEHVGWIVGTVRVAAFPLSGDVAVVVVPCETSDHVGQWQVAVARDYRFPAVAAAAGELHVFEVGVDDIAVDQVPRLVDRLAIANGMSEVPNDADAGVIGEVKHVSNALAGREGVVSFEGNANAVGIGRHGDLPQGFGDPAVDFVVGGAGIVVAAENADDRGVPRVGKFDESHGLIHRLAPVSGGRDGETSAAANDADFKAGVCDLFEDCRAVLLGHRWINWLAIEVAKLQTVKAQFGGDGDMALKRPGGCRVRGVGDAHWPDPLRRRPGIMPFTSGRRSCAIVTGGRMAVGHTFAPSPFLSWGTDLQQTPDAPSPWASISVFFPCHNEAENVEQVVGNALEHLPGVADDFEVIIVNDGSTDETAAIAGAIAEDDPRVRVVSHPTNLGYGRALRTGFESATGDLIFCADGDGQFSLEDLPAVVNALDDHGFVLGYRINRADPFYRRLNAWLWGLSVRILLGFRVRDLDCGFKLYRRDAVPVEEFISGRGAAISAELIARALRGGHSFTQVGVTHYPRQAGVQSGNSPRVIVNSFLDIIQLWRGLRSS